MNSTTVLKNLQHLYTCKWGCRLKVWARHGDGNKKFSFKNHCKVAISSALPFLAEDLSLVRPKTEVNLGW